MSPALPGAPRLVIGAPSCSESRQERPPRVWYSPEIDACKFTLHILSVTAGGFHWLKYIFLMLCNAARRLGDRKRSFLRQRVQGSMGAIRAVRNTWVFLTETGVVADDCNGEIVFSPPPLTFSLAGGQQRVAYRDSGILHTDWVTVGGIQTYWDCGDGLRDRECIFGRPQGRLTSSHYTKYALLLSQLFIPCTLVERS